MSFSVVDSTMYLIWPRPQGIADLLKYSHCPCQYRWPLCSPHQGASTPSCSHRPENPHPSRLHSKVPDHHAAASMCVVWEFLMSRSNPQSWIIPSRCLCSTGWTWQGLLFIMVASSSITSILFVSIGVYILRSQTRSKWCSIFTAEPSELGM